MSEYFNLEKSFGFYGAYHNNALNKLIHIFCVPLIFISSVELLSRFAPQSLILALLAFYVVSFIIMEPLMGVLYAPVLTAYYWIAVNLLSNYQSLSMYLFVGSWVAQFIGHGVFEKRAPALVTNLPQSLHAAVFFVWLEILFAIGLRKDLHLKLQGAVRSERSKRSFK